MECQGSAVELLSVLWCFGVVCMQRDGETDRWEDGEDKLSVSTVLRRVGRWGVNRCYITASGSVGCFQPLMRSHSVTVLWACVWARILHRLTVTLRYNSCLFIYETLCMCVCVHVQHCAPLLCEGCCWKWSTCITLVKITMATAAFAGNEIVSKLFGAPE